MANRGLEFTVAAGSAAIVDGKDRETFACQNFVEWTGRIFQYRLRRGTSVDVYDQGNLAGGRRGREQQASVKRGPAGRFEREELRGAQSIFGYFVARLPHRRARATHAAHRHSRRWRWAHEGLLVVFAIVGEFAEVKSLVMRELLQGGSVQLD